MAKTYNYTKLTGGTDGCLDALTDAIVEDGDFALGVVSGVQYSHYFDADSTTAASSPDVIEPISGSGRWLIAPSTILAGALTANNKLFVNAAGTGLENSSGLQLVFTTFDMSTDTGSFNVSCNFKPSLIECRTFIVGTNTSSDGTYSGGTELVKAYNPATSVWGQTACLAWAIINGTTHQSFSVSKLSDSKITIANTKTGSPTGTLQIHLRLFR
jgi:hypothetical protein